MQKFEEMTNIKIDLRLVNKDGLDKGLIQENIYTIGSNDFHEIGSQAFYGSTVTTGPDEY